MCKQIRVTCKDLNLARYRMDVRQWCFVGVVATCMYEVNLLILRHSRALHGFCKNATPEEVTLQLPN